MTQPNSPINPIPDLNYHPSSYYGLTKREYFAALAMQGMLANSAEGNTEWNYETMAKHCCIVADALVEQLNIKNK